MAVNQNPYSSDQAACFDSFVEELASDTDKIARYRQRLSDLSWLMSFLNEYIARKANREGQTKGRLGVRERYWSVLTNNQEKCSHLYV